MYTKISYFLDAIDNENAPLIVRCLSFIVWLFVIAAFTCIAIMFAIIFE